MKHLRTTTSSFSCFLGPIRFPSFGRVGSRELLWLLSAVFLDGCSTKGASPDGGETNTDGATASSSYSDGTSVSGSTTDVGNSSGVTPSPTPTGTAPITPSVLPGVETTDDADATATGEQSTPGASTSDSQPGEPSAPDTASGNLTDTAAGDTSASDTGDTQEGNVEIDPNALIVAADGDGNAAGTLDAPTTLASAVEKVSAGGTIYVRGGTYTFDSTIGLGANGTGAQPITLSGYPGDASRPRFDFSAMNEDSSNRGLSLSGDYWHVYGIDVFKAGDNCMFVSGSHNVIEFSTFSECADTGLQLGNGAADNLVLNCDSYFNADSSLENADGFAAKLDVGSGNKFVGCRAWNNLDDGWDGYLRPADNVTTTFERCWAIDNGKLKDGSEGAGDGNGFKTGGSDDKDLHHNVTYTQCIAAGNVHDGFDHNSNRGNITILNSAAHANGSNINFGSGNSAASLTIKNTISLGDNGSLEADATDITHNSWQDGRAATNDDFVSVDMAVLKSPRKSDGSLPDIDYLKLVSGSDLRNAGVDVGVPFNGGLPDIGAFESVE